MNTKKDCVKELDISTVYLISYIPIPGVGDIVVHVVGAHVGNIIDVCVVGGDIVGSWTNTDLLA